MQEKKAVIYRMVMPEHLCPYGLKSVYLLRRQGFEVEDHWLRTREETDAFKSRLGVETTPQTFIEGARVGGYDELRRFFGKEVRQDEESSYVPVLVVFAVAACIALAMLSAPAPAWSPARLVQDFVSIAMCLLAMLKLQDLEAFSTMFLNYDLLARRFVVYGYLYPFAELAAGLAMLAQRGLAVAAPLGLAIGGIGVASVVKAVYVDRRELRCACVGGNSSVPLGFVSLTESLAMAAMGLWMGWSAWQTA